MELISATVKMGVLGVATIPLLAAASRLTAAPDYAKDVEPILKASCFGCHGPQSAQGGLRLDTVDGVAKVIVAGKPEASKLIQRLLGKGGTPMPMGMPSLSAEKIKILSDWVAAGAPRGNKIPLGTLMGFFKGTCSSCHSGSTPAGGLDLTSAEGITRGGVSGAVYEKGKPGESLLIQRMRGLGGKPRMPKGFAPLSETQIAAVEAWIASGADLSMSGGAVHWAYQAIQKPAIPTTKDASWAKNPVDAFVLARLEKEGLKPSPEASRETLIRRLSLDLTGLPPTPEETDAFVADQSPNAYEKVVDRLLASPHYGEKQARIWLDLARYADSDGYEKDGMRSAWLYRDWVIKSFNRNMPYDRFTLEQLSGDLISGATTDTLVATGFHRNTMWNLEGGVDPDESRYEMLNDRVATTATVWLGQTFACARCHDHKYDPISQKDYFQLYAFFANTDYAVNGDRNVTTQTYSEPVLQVPSDEQKAQLRTLQKKIDTLQATLRADSPELDRDLAEWLAALRSGVVWQAKPLSASAIGTNLKVGADGAILASGANPERTRYRIRLDVPDGGISAVRIEALPHDNFVAAGPGRASSGNFILSKAWIETGGRQIVPSGAVATFVQGGYAAQGVLDDNPESGWAVAGRYGQPSTLLLTFHQPVRSGDPIEVVLDFGSKQWPNHNLGHFRVSVSDSRQASVELVPTEIRDLAKKDHRTDEEVQKLRASHRALSHVLAQPRLDLVSAELEMGRLKASIPTALVLKEKAAAATLKARIHIRGEFLNLGEEVEANSPSFLPPMKEGLPGNRAGLVRWLFDSNNPLTARVQANRMWESLFGRGLVETSENFGTQGTPPTHPELLDWLATELRQNGWNLKSLYKQMVMSATYRQSSRATKSLLAKDPDNQLLARGPRFRLEAEAIRDVALSASGLLSRKVGGPSVFPSQPAGVWDSPYSGEQWSESKGEDRYRRGLYTFWKRTSTYPSFMALDATSREQCTVRRTRTNTPLQSLALMNDPGMMEAAVALGQRMCAKPEDEGIAYGFRLCTGRKPAAPETQRMKRLLGEMRAHFANRPASETAKLGGSAEQAAWTMLGNVLLNLDETITKE